MRPKSSESTRRLNINLPDTMISDVDAYAQSMHINRTTAIILILSNFLNGQKNMDTLSDFLTVYHSEKDNRTSSEFSK